MQQLENPHNPRQYRIIEGQIESLRRFKDDVKEVAQGYECGITIDNYRDFREGDILEVYTMEEIPQK